MDEKDEEIIGSIMNPEHVGILHQIEQRRLLEVCQYFGITLTKDNFAYCMSIKATFDGFLNLMYGMADWDSSIKNPNKIAYELTALALGLFKKTQTYNKK